MLIDPDHLHMGLEFGMAGQDLIVATETPDDGRRERRIGLSGETDPDLIFTILLSGVRNGFFDLLPRQTIDVRLHEDLETLAAGMTAILGALLKVMENTNGLMQQYGHLKSFARDYPNVLFLRIDQDERFLDLFEAARQAYPGRACLIQGGRTGFNAQTRTWGDASMRTLPDLLQEVERARAGRIVSANMHYLEHVSDQLKADVPALMRFLGIRYVMYDVDIYDGAVRPVLSRSVFHDPDTTHVSIYPFLQASLDQSLDVRKVQYGIAYRSMAAEAAPFHLEPDYALFVLSHSRLAAVKILLQQIIFLFDHLGTESPHEDLFLWFLSVRRRIFGDGSRSLSQKLLLNSNLYKLFVGALSFIKILLIGDLKTDRPLKIYGDSGWGEIFPQYYQGRYAQGEEKEKLFSDGRHVNLLVNENYSYQQSHGVIQDAVHRNIPFLTLAPVAPTQELEGLRPIEYRNAGDLADRINALSVSLKGRELSEGLAAYRRMTAQCGAEVMDALMGVPRQQDFFMSCCRDNEERVQCKLDRFHLEKREAIEASWEVLLLGKETRFDLSRSVLMNRSYLSPLAGGSHG